LHLIQQKRMTPNELVDLLYRRSGVLGLSGISSDFRELLASDEQRAVLPCYRVARYIASLAAATGGIDGVVFTAGVGENAAPMRAAICCACASLGLELDEAANRAHRHLLGLELDEAANRAHGERISTRASRVAALVIKTDENR
jgi:acetate kinase